MVHGLRSDLLVAARARRRLSSKSPLRGGGVSSMLAGGNGHETMSMNMINYTIAGANEALASLCWTVDVQRPFGKSPALAGRCAR
jgi:hypothetical protein